MSDSRPNVLEWPPPAALGAVEVGFSGAVGPKDYIDSAEGRPSRSNGTVPLDRENRIGTRDVTASRAPVRQLARQAPPVAALAPSKLLVSSPP
jgi:hypothetical protein